jgi:hypothetical protein
MELPTTDMSERKRKLEGEQESRYAGPVAIVPRTAVFTDEPTRRWLTSPDAVEQRFRGNIGTYIPDNYVERFQGWLNSGRFLETGHSERDCWSDVLFCQAKVFWGRARYVELQKIFSRPCAWRLGFARLLFVHVLRFCTYHDLDLVLDEPYPAITALVRRIRDATNAYVEEEGFANGAVIHMKIPFRSLEAFAGHLGTDTSTWAHAPRDKTEDGKCALPDRLQLNPTKFPAAAELNHQPLSAA